MDGDALCISRSVTPPLFHLQKQKQLNILPLSVSFEATPVAPLCIWMLEDRELHTSAVHLPVLPTYYHSNRESSPVRLTRNNPFANTGARSAPNSKQMLHMRVTKIAGARSGSCTLTTGVHNLAHPTTSQKSKFVVHVSTNLLFSVTSPL